jgi:GNAT superfamily N-acetyltransferase
MLIRRALSNEADVLTQVALASKSFWGYSSAQIELWRDELAFTAGTIEKHATLVAEVNGQVVGVAQLNPTTEPWELEALWVHPAIVGRGVGTTLLGEALAVARASGQEAVAIDADPHAVSFYVSRGAMRVGVRSAPIPGEENRVRPQLTIKTSAVTATAAGGKFEAWKTGVRCRKLGLDGHCARQNRRDTSQPGTEKA